jgi:hypothetical protein
MIPVGSKKINISLHERLYFSKISIFNENQNPKIATSSNKYFQVFDTKS